MSATGSSFPAPTPQARCGPGSRPETDIQGRVPQRDYDSGRAAKGYRCNTRQVSHQGRTGGFKVLRYTDAPGPHLRVLRLHAALPEGRAVPVHVRPGPRRGRPRHGPPAQPAEDREPADPRHGHPARVGAAQPAPRAARRRLRQPRDRARRPRPLRREVQLPAPAAALLDAHGDPGPRERLVARRPDVLRLQHRRPDPGRPRPDRPDRAEADLRAGRRELPRHAGLRGRPHPLRRQHRQLRCRCAVLVRRAADPRRQRDPGPQARTRRSTSSRT